MRCMGKKKLHTTFTGLSTHESLVNKSGLRRIWIYESYTSEPNRRMA